MLGSSASSRKYNRGTAGSRQYEASALTSVFAADGKDTRLGGQVISLGPVTLWCGNVARGGEGHFEREGEGEEEG